MPKNAVDAMASNSKLGKDIFGVGMHYPSGSPSMSRKAPSYPSASQQQAAARLGKALISSEACSCVPSYSTAVAMAAAINRNYINGGITGFVNWALLVSWYDFLDYPNHGLFRATQPWSGRWPRRSRRWPRRQQLPTATVSKGIPRC